jgi:hypothetical protein
MAMAVVVEERGREALDLGLEGLATASGYQSESATHQRR